jgi:8-oxo-dGTP diphosphatase
VVAAVRSRAELLTSAPVVVGAVIVRRADLSTSAPIVLAAQRDHPPVLAGRWEFPGGRVEPGEDEPAAVVRECREELAADVVVGDRLGPDLVLPNGFLLRLYRAELAADAVPAANDHRAIRWLSAVQLSDVDWLPADRAVLPLVGRLLRPSTTGVSHEPRSS